MGTSLQEDMSCCCTGGHVFLLEVLLSNKNTDFLFQQEDIPSCPTGDTSSFSTARRVVLFNKKTCLVVQQEDMPPCGQKTTCLSFEQEGMSSGWTRRHAFLLSKKTCLLAHMDIEWLVLKINCLGSHAGVIWLIMHSRVFHLRP